MAAGRLLQGGAVCLGHCLVHHLKFQVPVSFVNGISEKFTEGMNQVLAHVQVNPLALGRFEDDGVLVIFATLDTHLADKHWFIAERQCFDIFLVGLFEISLANGVFVFKFKHRLLRLA